MNYIVVMEEMVVIAVSCWSGVNSNEKMVLNNLNVACGDNGINLKRLKRV